MPAITCNQRFLRTWHGVEFTAHAVRNWFGRIGVMMLNIEPGSSWENGCNESFNGKLKDELPSRNIFKIVKKANIMTER
jgi:transposase InsO family protein